jgi:hypothetical protein
MKSFRLYAWQIKRIRNGGGSAVLDAAVQRWQSGELSKINVIQNADKKEKCDNVLQVYSVRRSYPYTSAEMREILSAHFAKPINFMDEIYALDREISAMMGEYSGIIAFDHATGKAIEV